VDTLLIQAQSLTVMLEPPAVGAVSEEELPQAEGVAGSLNYLVPNAQDSPGRQPRSLAEMIQCLAGLPGIDQALAGKYVQAGINLRALQIEYWLKEWVMLASLNELEGFIHKATSLSDGFGVRMGALDGPVFTHVEEGKAGSDLHPQGMVED
jgi:hypothetical protein